jgi:hypothetical protein
MHRLIAMLDIVYTKQRPVAYPDEYINTVNPPKLTTKGKNSISPTAFSLSTEEDISGAEYVFENSFFSTK